MYAHIPFGDVRRTDDAESRYVYFGTALRRTPGDGKFWCTRTFTLGAPGAVPAGGEKILMIVTERRNRGFRLMIMTDEVVVVIDIP